MEKPEENHTVQKYLMETKCLFEKPRGQECQSLNVEKFSIGLLL